MARTTPNGESIWWVAAICGLAGIVAFQSSAFGNTGRLFALGWLAMCFTMQLGGAIGLSAQAKRDRFRFVSALGAWVGTVACGLWALWAMNSIATMYRHGEDLAAWYVVDGHDHMSTVFVIVLGWVAAIGSRAGAAPIDRRA